MKGLLVRPRRPPKKRRRLGVLVGTTRSLAANVREERFTLDILDLDAGELVGSIRRECLDHIIVWNQRALRRILRSYFAYYQHSRTHLALGKDAPQPRTVEPPDQGRVFAIPQVGGLHHRYQRRAALVNPQERRPRRRRRLACWPGYSVP